ncbi:GNAT family N-acetyltransferase [Kribbella sp. NBC_00889]|uniref:GNAT family N-acetyltransferase n=1 Tax=Kribbella sp. NBC_00889 TaxID=2975974 RepID=UPI00386ED95F|nr:GNAT family N-acetyltransferase [Kribbella sp. NBC_00889]
MSTVTAAEFTWPLGDDAVLIPRTAAIAEAHFALVEANYQRLAQWFGDAYQEPPVLEETRATLEEAGRGWLDGSLLPLSIAVKADNGWRLVGWAQLEIDRQARSAEIGYWLDTDFVGRGLVSRTVTAVLDHAFGPLGLLRVGLCTTVDNTRSRNVAERMGFTQEGVLREAAVFPNERRDLVLYGLLAHEWQQ